jgi:transcriptional regulator with XRE-family HTH domain
MTKTFRDALKEAVAMRATPIKQVAAETGVSYEQLKKVLQREGASTNVDDAVKVAHFFGFSLDEFLGDTTAQDRIEIVEQYNRLSPQERDLLRDVARGRRGEAPPEAS